jgi:hypothetical protein
MMTVLTYQAKEHKILWPSFSPASRNSTVFSRYRQPLCVTADSRVTKNRETPLVSKGERK